MKRFQSYDAISHQIESTEFLITEAYLLRKKAFLQELIIAIAKHVDNIKAVNALYKNKYESFLKNLDDLIEDKPINKNFLQQAIIRKLAQDIMSVIYQIQSRNLEPWQLTELTSLNNSEILIL